MQKNISSERFQYILFLFIIQVVIIRLLSLGSYILPVWHVSVSHPSEHPFGHRPVTWSQTSTFAHDPHSWRQASPYLPSLHSIYKGTIHTENVISYTYKWCFLISHKDNVMVYIEKYEVFENWIYFVVPVSHCGPLYPGEQPPAGHSPVSFSQATPSTQ